MTHLVERFVRELLNDADGYFYFVQRPSLCGEFFGIVYSNEIFSFLEASHDLPNIDDDNIYENFSVLTW